ncbi:chaperone protein dnaJ 11, chloroplastic [Amborella trichopoda]|uniref:J domain-containing protein n=1 Tax=Amborella trichopoda TaxID=13333 RepID=U5DA78_AMBTC|nr:chaperone protein dnaJ 11, chloroplastic [Amborella trichopoda]ERN19100.1 hypothetical protein AMTR_s00061p00131740 [Amborella trichopoda]|eukprot:XP_006857633.1 chaperone protein dnaJ 11, chloroplastic [Amborella trichopoda]
MYASSPTIFVGERLSLTGNRFPITRLSLSNGFSSGFPSENRLSATNLRRKSAFSVSIKAFAETTCRNETADLQAEKQRSFYEILCVKETASLSEIKTAYRTLVKRFHPDAVSAGSNGRDFIKIRDAYSTLSDPKERAVYDLSIGVGKPPMKNGYGSLRGFRTTKWETDQCW